MLGDYFCFLATHQLSICLVTEITLKESWKPRADDKFAL